MKVHLFVGVLLLLIITIPAFLFLGFFFAIKECKEFSPTWLANSVICFTGFVAAVRIAYWHFFKRHES